MIIDNLKNELYNLLPTLVVNLKCIGKGYLCLIELFITGENCV